MSKRIQPSEGTLPSIRDIGPSLHRIEASQVQAALGADVFTEGIEEALAPVTLFALREELVKRLQSSGGRPGLSGTTRRAKIPLSEQEWLQLEELAASISSPGFAPSAGQVASVLLTLAVHSVAARVARAGAGQAGSPLIRELAVATAGESAQRRTQRRA